MNEARRLEKNEAIRQSMLATKARHRAMTCKVFELKLQSDRLTKSQQECLKMMFVEAKWVYNAVLSFEGNAWDYPRKIHSVQRKLQDGTTIEQKLEYLGSQMRQGIRDGLIGNIRNLAKAKKSGIKIGKLKFKSEYRSINLVQYQTTYKFKESHIKIQGIPSWVKINGLKQIPKEAEFANAKLLNRPDGYFLKVTTYLPKEPNTKQGEIGIDLGISTAVTLSDGRKFKASVEESERLKRLQKQMFRRQKGSNNRRKTIKKIKIEYQKLTNKKNDLANKIVHEIKQYKDIYMQDENLRNWSRKFGRQVRRSILGRIKAKLLQDAFVLDRFVPTTKACYNCGQVHEMPLSKRVFECDCGIEPEDRDIKAAKSMIVFGKLALETGKIKLKSVPMGCRELGTKSAKKPAETGTNTSEKSEASSGRRNRKKSNA